MNRKLVYLCCLIFATALFLVSCQNQGVRSIITVESFNNNAPFFSDVLNDDGTIPEDYISVLFSNRPLTSSVTSSSLHNFVITRYRVQYTRSDGNPAVPPPYEAATSIVVTPDEFAFASLLIVPFGHKTLPPLDALVSSGEIIANANFTFWGHDMGSEREVDFSASTVVTFANFVDG